MTTGEQPHVYNGGLVIDQRVKTYMEEHPKVNYHDALRALLREKKAEERALRQEFDRRVEHEINSGYKDYDFAAERVLRSDPKNMAMAYADVTDQAGLAQRVGEVMSAAKKAAALAKIPLSRCRSANLGRTARHVAKNRGRLAQS